MSAAALAEAMTERFCHDIAGPAGTIAALLDLAADEPGQSGESLTLAREAAMQMLRRIRVTRAAWGGLDPWPESELSGLLAQIASRHLQIALSPATAAFRRTIGVDRLLLNVALLGAEALRGHGLIAFEAGVSEVTVTLSGAGPAALAQWPPFETEATQARLVQSTWTACAASACGARLRPNGATLRILSLA